MKALFERRPDWLLALLILIGLMIVNARLQHNFFEPRVLISNLSTYLPLILVAIGQTYVILSSDIDLSVGAIISLVNVIVVSVIEALGGGGGAILVGIACGVLSGVACGIFNGFCVAVLRLQAIVTTFATGIVFAGLALWVLPAAGKQAPAAFWQIYGGGPGLPTVLWILLATLIVLLWFSRSGLHQALLAVGGDRQAAYRSGLPVARLRITGYAACGLFAALAALCLLGETATGDPLLGGAYTLSSISAVVLGGTALSGGVGGALGSVFGALILGLINNLIFFARLPFEYQNLVQGLIVLAALAGGVLFARR